MEKRRLIALFLGLLLAVSSVITASAEIADGVISITLSSATDEELAEAAALIKAEQKARLKTTITLDPAEATVNAGATLKIAAAVNDLPDGVTAGKFTWSSSDDGIASCGNGTVKGVSAGSAVITCLTTLSDGTEVTGEMTVTVLMPVKSLAFGAKKMDVMAGDVFTPEITVSPEDASDKAVTLTSSDEKVVRVEADGQLTALLNGRATITAVANDGSKKTAKLDVTVTKRIGKYDDELTFQGLAWGSDDKTAWKKLQETGFVSAENERTAYNSSYIHYWPSQDLLFANSNSWQELPVAFQDQGKGAAQMSFEPEMKVGGYSPQSASLYFLNAIGPDGQIDEEKKELVGVYFYFDNKHERGADIFVDLLSKMEAQYGEFTRFLARDLTRSYYKEMYGIIKSSMEGAKEYRYKDLGKDLYLSSYAICTLRGKNNTGISLMINSSEYVTLFYGKTDALEQIYAIQSVLEAVPDDKKDAGI